MVIFLAAIDLEYNHLQKKYEWMNMSRDSKLDVLGTVRVCNTSYYPDAESRN